MAEHTLDAPDLPELSDEAVDRMESHVFARIAAEHTANVAQLDDRSRRRRRGYSWFAAAAAVVLVGAVAIPSVIGATRGGVSTSADGGAAPQMPMTRQDESFDQPKDAAATTTDGSAPGAAADSAQLGTDVSPIEAQIVRSAQVSLTVKDIDGAADKLADLANAKGGSVQSTSIGTMGDPMRAEDAPVDTGWVTVRVPAAQLDAVLKEIGGVGEVTAQTVDASDVTSQSVDLTARVQSLETSVERLRDLMAKAGSVGDLLAAETALSQREQELESYQQQLDALKDQVAMSSVGVTLTLAATAKADPAGFGDGVSNGWAGLVATLNGIIIGLGFLLPWIAVVGVLALVVWGIVRLVRARRRHRAADAATAPATPRGPREA